MAISIDTLRSLDANKSYYIANSTGEIKEAGAWQKFKCLFGIGDGRAKAAKLVDAVKATLLESSRSPSPGSRRLTARRRRRPRS